MQGADYQGMEPRIRKKLRSKQDAEIREGITMTDSNFRHRVARLIESNFPSFPPEDVADIWQETLLTLWLYALARKVDKEGSLMQLLWTIARFHSLNCLRGNLRRIKADSDGVERRAFHAQDLAGLTDLLIDLEQFLGKLKEKQKLVLRTYVELVCSKDIKPGPVPWGLLTDTVNKKISTPMSQTAVRSAFRTVQGKVIIYLVIKGYYR